MADKKRVLLVLRRMGIGGIEQATKTLATALESAGHEAHLLVLKGASALPSDTPFQTHHHDVDRVSRKGLGRLCHLADKLLLTPLIKQSGFIWRGKRCSQEFKRYLGELEDAYGHFDLILIRGQGAFENLWAFDDERTWRVVEAVTGRFPANAKGRWLARALYQDKKLLFVSRGVEKEVGQYLERQGVTPLRGEILYNAVPIPAIRRMANADKDMHLHQPYLLHVARLVPVKNQQRLIAAFHQAVNQGLDHDLVIIGDGSERRHLEAQVMALGLAAKVHFLGKKDNPYPWMKDATALVLSSNFEGLGIVLIEALALGTQCVACDVPGGIDEVLTGPQARLLAAPTVEALADKMREAVTDPVTIDDSMVKAFEAPRIISDLVALAPETKDVLYAPST
ncbi:glycosyltransferase [Halomonas denitrificans]|uniref:glycosyltransferase n=1 Tax=Halomonas denitrificans TaxID=370769 RepID=UPI001C993C8D|nr:glycosyltransferase [Halomonas denitrificans]MBY5969548.1 glycosyltransferase [Halomonas denitrificans]